MQVEDTSKLDYEAGPNDSKEKPPQKPPQKQPQQKQQQEQQAGDDEAADEGQDGLNEDTEDRFEDSQFAPPTAPEQVRPLDSLRGM